MIQSYIFMVRADYHYFTKELYKDHYFQLKVYYKFAITFIIYLIDILLLNLETNILICCNFYKQLHKIVSLSIVCKLIFVKESIFYQ